MSLIDAISIYELIYMGLVLFAAYTIKGIAGFGSGLLAVPLLALVAPLTLVVPLLGLVSYTGTVIQAFQLRKHVVWRDCLLVLPFSIIGVIIALWLLKEVDLFWLNKGLAIFIVAYSLHTLRPEKKAIKHHFWAIPAGFLAGLVGALFGTGGPFYVTYLKLRQLDKTAFKATIVFIFLFDGAIRITGYSVSGFYASNSIIIALLALPVLFLGLYLGHRIHLDMSKQRFNQIISLILLFSGLMLLFK